MDKGMNLRAKNREGHIFCTKIKLILGIYFEKYSKTHHLKKIVYVRISSIK